ncbi:endonuclease/exonuclease/phosphatase family protein [Planctomycetaceae bacterium SH139]
MILLPQESANVRHIMILILLLGFSLNGLSASAERPAELKIITHNVWYGFTKKGQPRHEQWLQWMATQQPDVVALQELNGYTAEKLAADAKNWGHPHSVLLKEEGFPTGITSRYPITDVAKIRQGMHHGLLRCRIEGIWFYVIHFHPSNFARRIEEAGHLQADIATLPDVDPRIVLAGDFNGFSPLDRRRYDSDDKLVPFFEMLDGRSTSARNLNQGKLDYGGLEAIMAQDFFDAVAGFRDDAKPFVGTFPTSLVSDENHGTDRRLDYIFVSPNMQPHLESADILRDQRTELLSDHIPVRAVLRFGPEG